MEPRRNESRFLQTGSRINMQLKFRHAAGALAQERACCEHTQTQRERGELSFPILSSEQHIFSIQI